jgi:hypothetical protein
MLVVWVTGFFSENVVVMQYRKWPRLAHERFLTYFCVTCTVHKAFLLMGPDHAAVIYIVFDRTANRPHSSKIKNQKPHFSAREGRYHTSTLTNTSLSSIAATRESSNSYHISSMGFFAEATSAFCRISHMAMLWVDEKDNPTYSAHHSFHQNGWKRQKDHRYTDHLHSPLRERGPPQHHQEKQWMTPL